MPWPLPFIPYLISIRSIVVLIYRLMWIVLWLRHLLGWGRRP